jgi:hypothetical protein
MDQTDEVAKGRREAIQLYISYSTGIVSFTVLSDVAELNARFNIKNPAGDYVQHDRNVEVFRQVSQAKAKREKEEVQEAKAQAAIAASNGEGGVSSEVQDVSLRVS